MRGRYVEFTSAGKVALRDYEVPEVPANHLLVETLYSVISPGTERAFLLAEPNTDTARAGFPFRPGYSSLGRVLRVGPHATDVRVGQLVATMAGHQSHVIVRPPLNSPRQRAVDAYFEVADGTVMSWRLPEGLDREAQKGCAGFIIFTVGLFGARRAGIQLGSQVIVVGLGPIGLSAGQFARLAGALPLVGVARTPERRRIAEKIGFDKTCPSVEVLQRELPTYADAADTIVIEATGRPDGVLSALDCCPVGGRVVLLGSTRGSVPEFDFYSRVHRKALTLVGAHQSTRPTSDHLHGRWNQYWDADTTLRMILTRRLDVHSLLTTECRVSDVADAYQMICDVPNTLCIALAWDAS